MTILNRLRNASIQFADEQCTGSPFVASFYATTFADILLRDREQFVSQRTLLDDICRKLEQCRQICTKLGLLFQQSGHLWHPFIASLLLIRKIARHCKC